MMNYFRIIAIAVLIWALSIFLAGWLGVLKGVYQTTYLDYIQREIKSKYGNSQKNSTL